MFSCELKEALEHAAFKAFHDGRALVTAADLFMGMCTERLSPIRSAFNNIERNEDNFWEYLDANVKKRDDAKVKRPSHVFLDPVVCECIEEAWWRSGRGATPITSSMLLNALLEHPKSEVALAFEKWDVETEAFQHACGIEYERIRNTERARRVKVDLGEKKASVILTEDARTLHVSTSAYEALTEFGQDMVGMAAMNCFSPIIGRGPEIEEVITVFGRRKKNNPLLIGEPGVGKTAIVQGLANLMAADSPELPEDLRGKDLFLLDLAAVISGTTYRGDFEKRVKSILREVEEAHGQVLLFIDEIHTVVGGGAARGGMDASNLLKPALADGTLKVIGATTLDEYRKYFERDAALERRFAPVMVEEPTADQALEILRGSVREYERHHGVRVAPDALGEIVTLSERYDHTRRFPDKALECLDDTAGMTKGGLLGDPNELPEFTRTRELSEALPAAILRMRMEGRFAEAALFEMSFLPQVLHCRAEFAEKNDRAIEEIGDQPLIVSVDHVRHAFSRRKRIPVQTLSHSDAERALGLEAALKARVFGQPEAVEEFSDGMLRAIAGMRFSNGPRGVFLLLGPTGVGKTELARGANSVLGFEENQLIKLDMSEYMEKHAVSKLIGAPPGYVGYSEAGRLTEAVRHRPYSVVLLDEIEKAHPDIQNIFLQIFEDGTCRDGMNRRVDFTHTVILLTSNLGMSKLGQAIVGFGSQPIDIDELRGSAMKEVRRFFRPESLNRMDGILFFNPLGPESLNRILDRELGAAATMLDIPDVSFSVEPTAREAIFSMLKATEGARGLKRTIARTVGTPATRLKLRNEIKPGHVIHVAHVDERFHVELRRAEEAAPEASVDRERPATPAV